MRERDLKFRFRD